MNIEELMQAGEYSSVDHPYIEFAEVDDIWIRAYSMEKAESYAGQHIHAHDHMTIVSRGTVEAWQDSMLMGVYTAPAIIKVQAGKAHAFKALTDDVVFCCIHNLRGTGLESPEIIEGA